VPFILFPSLFTNPQLVLQNINIKSCSDRKRCISMQSAYVHIRCNEIHLKCDVPCLLFCSPIISRRSFRRIYIYTLFKVAFSVFGEWRDSHDTSILQQDSVPEMYADIHIKDSSKPTDVTSKRPFPMSEQMEYLRTRIRLLLWSGSCKSFHEECRLLGCYAMWLL
jgi:hypothetical protein